mgnify:CR=1 FL=1
MSIQEDKPAPDFSLAGSDGATHGLADYAGRTVVIYFYPKDDTPGCTKESCRFGELLPAFTDAGTIVLGVSKDSLASHDRFIRKFNLPFVLLSDPDSTMMQAYDAWGEKMLYGKKHMGTIRSTVVIGPDGAVQKHWPKVTKAGTHPDEVLAFLRG